MPNTLVLEYYQHGWQQDHKNIHNQRVAAQNILDLIPNILVLIAYTQEFLSHRHQKFFSNPHDSGVHHTYKQHQYQNMSDQYLALEMDRNYLLLPPLYYPYRQQYGFVIHQYTLPNLQSPMHRFLVDSLVLVLYRHYQARYFIVHPYKLPLRKLLDLQKQTHIYLDAESG